MRTISLAIFATALTAFAATGGAAQDAPPQAPQKVGKACKADREKFCADVKPGEGRIAECYRQHASELSEGCTSALQAARAIRKNINQACKADKKKFCADVEKGKGRVMDCLEQHGAELEAACSAALKERPGKRRVQ